MEEVTRFLERCYQSFETIKKTRKMENSNYMYANNPHFDSTARSYSVDLSKKFHRIGLNTLNKSQTTNGLNETFSSTSTSSSGQSNDIYNNFTDFTW